MQNFSLPEANRLYETSPQVIAEGKIVKDITPVANYIKQFMFPLTSGGHVVLEDGKYVYMEQADIKKVFFNRMNKEINVWYFNKYDQLYRLINDVHKPALVDNKINMCSGFKWKVTKKYSEFPAATRKKVDVFLGYMKEVLCDNNMDSLKYLLKYYSHMCKGKKNDSTLYFKGPEGTGKSTNIEFLTKYVLGLGICVKPTIECLTTAYNKVLCGKVLVVFEEMPTFSTNQWEGISGKLKEMITGDRAMYRDLYEKSFEADNINNYIINTNVDAIKHSQGRRYFIADVSTKRMKDFAYFANIKDTCFNDEVGEAFFHYLLEVDTSKYNAQMDMPETQNKLAAIADRLEVVYQFLKFDYILAGKGIDCRVTELYALYQSFCKERDSNPLSNHKFYAKLREIQIEYKKIGGIHMYRVSAEQLKAIADKNKWIHEIDEFEKPQVKQTPYLFANDPLEAGIDKTDMAVHIPEDDMTVRLKKFLDETAILHELLKKTCISFQAIKLEEPRPLTRDIVKPKLEEVEAIREPTPKKKTTPKKKKQDLEVRVPDDEDELDATVADLFNC